jgi:hypothetical protein
MAMLILIAPFWLMIVYIGMRLQIARQRRARLAMRASIEIIALGVERAAHRVRAQGTA